MPAIEFQDLGQVLYSPRGKFRSVEIDGTAYAIRAEHYDWLSDDDADETAENILLDHGDIFGDGMTAAQRADANRADRAFQARMERAG